MWVYLLIGLILVVAFGPVLWLRPSARERRLAGLRQRAYQEGMRVELRRLPDPAVAAAERVTAGGRMLDTTREVAAYLMPLPRRLRRLPSWRLVRGDSGSRALDGWSFEVGKRPESGNLPRLLDALAAPLAELPEDVVALQCEPLSVAGYWLEGPDASPDRVADLAVRLAAVGAALTALEARLETEAEPGNI